MTLCSKTNVPIFLHLDSLHNDKKDAEIVSLCEEIVEHMLAHHYFKDDDKAKSISESPIKIIHSSKVTYSQQVSQWECGYYVLHSIERLRTCAALKRLCADVVEVNMTLVLGPIDVIEYRVSLAFKAISDAREQRSKWVDISPDDSSTWRSCSIIDIRVYTGGETWYHLNFTGSAKTQQRVWCELTSDTIWWS